MIEMNRYQFIAFYLNISMLYELVNLGFFIIFHESIPFINYIYKAILCILLISAFCFILKDGVKFFKLILTVLFWGILFYCSSWFTPEILELRWKFAYYTIANVICVIYLFSMVDDIEELIIAFNPYILISLIYGVVQLIVFSRTKQYSMQFTYSTLIPCLLILTKDKHKFFDWCAFSFLICTNIICGSRGGLLCLCIAGTMNLLFSNNYQKKTIIIWAAIIFGFLFIINISLISSVLATFFPSSRTIQYLAEGDYFHLSRRDYYYQEIINSIKNEGWRIHGLYSDRVRLWHYFGDTNYDDMFGRYTHNFALEIMYQFGFIGVIILFGLVVYIIQSGKKIKDYSEVCLFIISVSFALGQLLFSGSYLTSISFGWVIGACICINKKEQNPKFYVSLNT